MKPNDIVRILQNSFPLVACVREVSAEDSTIYVRPLGNGNIGLLTILSVPQAVLNDMPNEEFVALVRSLELSYASLSPNMPFRCPKCRAVLAMRFLLTTKWPTDYGRKTGLLVEDMVCGGIGVSSGLDMYGRGALRLQGCDYWEDFNALEAVYNPEYVMFIPVGKSDLIPPFGRQFTFRYEDDMQHAQFVQRFNFFATFVANASRAWVGMTGGVE